MAGSRIGEEEVKRSNTDQLKSHTHGRFFTYISRPYRAWEGSFQKAEQLIPNITGTNSRIHRVRIKAQLVIRTSGILHAWIIRTGDDTLTDLHHKGQNERQKLE